MEPGSVGDMSGPTLRIIAINDVYILENLPRLKSLVEHYRAVDPADAFIVTLAGDFVSPSLLSSLDSGAGMVDCMNEVGVTHAIFGNHEDDIPSEELHKRVQELRGICLGTNLPGYDVRMPASQVIEVAGASRTVRVGLVGVVIQDLTIYRRVPFDGKAVLAPNVAATREAERLVREAHCAVVIPLTHQALPDDRLLAHAQKNPPFPVILGGHEHTLFVEKVDDTWILKAPSEAVQAIVVDMVWPDIAPGAGALDLPQTRVHVDEVANYPEDAELRAKVDAHLRILTDIENATLVTPAPGEVLSSVGARTQQTTLGTLLATCVRTMLLADAACLNGGGIRGARTYPERFSYADLRAEVPFDNELVTVSLPGAVVQDALRASRAANAAVGGGYFQVDDRVVVDADNAIREIDGAPFDAAKTYRIALVRNLLAGLDHNEPLIRFAAEHPEAVPRENSGRNIKLVLAEAFAQKIWDSLGSFAKLDRNHDGTVSADEIRAALRDMGGKEPSPVTTQLVLTNMDADKDGVVSEEDVRKRRSPSR